MSRIWTTLDTVDTPDGRLELRRRGERDVLITLAGRVLMSSHSTRSEEQLAQLACERLAEHDAPEVLIGGLGLGYTLREALARLPAGARVTVAELNEQVVAWCRGPAADVCGHALDDPRTEVRIADVTAVIAAERGRWDAIALDLYEGPNAALHGPYDPLYGAEAIEAAHAALRPGGVFVVWSEQRDAAFEQRLERAPFAEVRWRHPPRGARRHVNYVARRAGGARAGSR